MYQMVGGQRPVRRAKPNSPVTPRGREREGGRKEGGRRKGGVRRG